MTHRWHVEHDDAHHARTPSETLEPLVARVLWARGLRETSDIDHFRDVRLSGLHDPDLLANCYNAAKRILDAIRARQPIVIYGDYDVDGVCASAILYHTIRDIDPDAPVSTYVPHRVDEGYGLHDDAITALAQQGAKLIISVDCGVTAFAQARTAASAGVDLIITDHHALAHAAGAPALPEAFAVVHPAHPERPYPFPDLCGAAVAFKLAWRLTTLDQGSSRVSESSRNLLLDALALAALGTVADVVPLVGENRLIARHGLRRLRHTALTGLQALIKASTLDGENIDSEQVGFILAPRLNACGRMGHARDAVEMLTTASPARAAEIARELSKLNDARRRTEKRIFDEANEAAIQLGMTADNRRAIVLAGEEWHAGVVGIVCSRLVERYHRPTILLQKSEGVCHGSGRSIDSFDLHAALSQCSHHLSKFGGHRMAAGLTLDEHRLEAFTNDFTDHANNAIAAEQLTPILRVDCHATLNEISPRAVEQMLDLGPFGRGNPAPSVVVRNVTIARTPEHMGQGGKHLRFHLRQGARELRIVGFGWGARADKLRAGMTVSAVIKPTINRWNGSARVEAELRDITPDDT